MISFMGPNIFWEDVKLSLKLLLSSPSNKIVTELESEFSKKFQSEAVSFNSGRSAFLAILESLNLKTGDEVALQTYTCVAVPDVVLWAGLKPLYIDINSDDFNMNSQDLEKKITPKTKVLIIQHTFGIPADLDKLLKIAKKNNLLVIEDCAHSTGVKFQDQYLGTFGDAAFFSFGRDKMLSSVFGGMVITQNQKLAEKIRNYQQKLEFPTSSWVQHQLLYNPLTFLITQTYSIGLGKLIHLLSKNLGLLSKAVLDLEKTGQKPDYFPKKMPAALSELALNQLKRLDLFNTTRLKFSNRYYQTLKNLPIKLPPKEIPLLRFVIQTEDRDNLKSFARENGIFLDTWYDLPIAPKGTDFSAISYVLGFCPVAEEISKKSLNLPTNPNLSDIQIENVISLIQNYYVKK